MKHDVSQPANALYLVLTRIPKVQHRIDNGLSHEDCALDFCDYFLYSAFLTNNFRIDEELESINLTTSEKSIPLVFLSGFTPKKGQKRLWMVKNLK